MRLIDADALKARKVYSRDLAENVVPTACIDWAETIDAVQVVRCGECKHMQKDELFGELRCRGREVKPNWFCADGDKKK